MEERVNKSGNMIRALNSVLWNGKVTRITKRRIYRTLVLIVILYGAEVWDLTKSDKDRLRGMEMDFCHGLYKNPDGIGCEIVLYD